MRPLPQETCDRLQRLLRTHDQRTAASIIGINERTVSLIRRRGFKAGGGPRRPMPADYAIQAQHMSTRDLERHYGAGGPTIARWNKQIGREPRWVTMEPLPVPSRADLEQAVREHGVTQAHTAFGVSRQTMLDWRKKRGMPYRGKKPEPVATSGWVERYVAEMRA